MTNTICNNITIITDLKEKTTDTNSACLTMIKT